MNNEQLNGAVTLHRLLQPVCIVRCSPPASVVAGKLQKTKDQKTREKKPKTLKVPQS